jgi:hypothetical protein
LVSILIFKDLAKIIFALAIIFSSILLMTYLFPGQPKNNSARTVRLIVLIITIGISLGILFAVVR